MNARTVHPGSIQARVGSCLRMIEVNIEQCDVRGMWNFVQQLQTYVSVYLKRHPDLKESLAQLRNPAELEDGVAFENMQRRQEICLEALHRANLYGYDPGGVGDATDLALRDEDEVPA